MFRSLDFSFLPWHVHKDSYFSAAGSLEILIIQCRCWRVVELLLSHELNIQLMPCESPCSGSSSSPVAWPLTVMLSCFWEEGFFSASLSSRMPLPSHSPSFRRCHILPHSLWCPPSPASPYPSLCDWLLFDNWPLLVLLFEPTIV